MKKIALAVLTLSLISTQLDAFWTDEVWTEIDKPEPNLGVISKYLKDNKATSEMICEAVKKEHTKVVKLLLKNVNLKGVCFERKHPLHIAAQLGNFKIVRYLLEHNAHVNVAAHSRWYGECRTPLYIAAQAGHTSIVRLLLLYKADIHFKYEEKTPFDIAALNGYLESAQVLLEHGAQEYVTGALLHRVVQTGHVNIARFLLEQGADVNYVTSSAKGAPPLHVAVVNHNLEMARLLINYGADLYATNWQGKIALELTSNDGFDDKCVVLLLQAMEIDRIKRAKISENETKKTISAKIKFHSSHALEFAESFQTK